MIPLSRAKFDSLYLGNGYLNMRGLSSTAPFVFVAAARGTGKTYGACEIGLNEFMATGEQFIWIRRTNTQAEIISQDEFSPFKALQTPTVTKRINKYVSGVYIVDENGEHANVPAGYILGLSTFSNVRGFNARRITRIFYDEFIPEQQEKAFAKDEAEALWNAYETINRNREFDGEKPVQLICMANSNRLDNDYFVSLGVVGTLWDMMRKGREFKLLKERNIALCLPTKSPISKKKAETALYRAVGDGHFARMALENDFGFDTRNVASRALVEYRPIIRVGELAIYEHKSRGEYYVSRHARGGKVPTYGSESDELSRFKANNMWLWRAHLLDMVWYEDAACKAIFDRYFR